MIPLVTLLVITFPALVGLCLLYGDRRGVTTPVWLQRVDEALLAAVPTSGRTESTYTFPPSHPNPSWRELFHEIADDYRYTERVALAKWD